MRHASLGSALLFACTANPAPDTQPRPESSELVTTPPQPSSPSSPTWTALKIAPGCALQVADHPAKLGPPVLWTPCGPDGCREAVTQLGDASMSGLRLLGHTHAGQVTLAVSHALVDSRVRYTLAPLDGAPFLALEGPTGEGCSLGQIGLSPAGGVVEVAYDHADGYASRAYLRGPLAEDPAWHEVAAVLPRADFPRFIGESVHLVDGRVLVEQNGGPLRWWDGEARRWLEVPGSGVGWACCASSVGDAVTFAFSAIPERPMAARLGEPAHPLLPATVEGSSPVLIDGARAVWAQGTGRDNNNNYKQITLWTADVAAGPSLNNARLVQALPHSNMPTLWFGGGTVAVSIAGHALAMVVVRLGSPDRAHVLIPPPGRLARVLWIAGDEIAVHLDADSARGVPPIVRRITLSSLPSAS